MNKFTKHLQQEFNLKKQQNRRQFLKTGGTALTGAALSSIIPNIAYGSGSNPYDFSRPLGQPLAPIPPAYPAKAKRVIYLHMAGGPSQLELFEHKPELQKYDGKDCPEEFFKGKRFAFISGVPKLLGPRFPFKQQGECGAWLSNQLPHLAKHIDDICLVKSMTTKQFNHAPAQLMTHTGAALAGSPSLGAWVNYGLGTVNQNLPGYVTLLSGGARPDGNKSLWGTGYLPGVYQGVECRSQGDPVLYLSNPKNVTRSLRRRILDTLADVNQHRYQQLGDPEIITRTAQFEMAYRMQLEASDAFDIKQESEKTLAEYGAKPSEASYANNCLLARRLAERGVRFIQLFDQGWDHHGETKERSCDHGIALKTSQVDKATAALLSDLKRTGMLEDTLVVWGGEFGRTPMQENRDGQTNMFSGRDHHPDAYTMWMAGAGIKGGISYGETDELGYSIVKNPVDVHDLHATILYLLGFNHKTFTYDYQGLAQRLTGLHEARIVSEILG